MQQTQHGVRIDSNWQACHLMDFVLFFVRSFGCRFQTDTNRIAVSVCLSQRNNEDDDEQVDRRKKSALIAVDNRPINRVQWEHTRWAFDMLTRFVCNRHFWWIISQRGSQCESITQWRLSASKCFAKKYSDSGKWLGPLRRCNHHFGLNVFLEFDVRNVTATCYAPPVIQFMDNYAKSSPIIIRKLCRHFDAHETPPCSFFFFNFLFFNIFNIFFLILFHQNTFGILDTICNVVFDKDHNDSDGKFWFRKWFEMRPVSSEL